MKDFSQRLEMRLGELGWTQTDLARATQTTQSTVHRWLNGSIPRSRTLMEICDALKTHKNWLLEGVGPKMIDDRDEKVGVRYLPAKTPGEASLREGQESLTDGVLNEGDVLHFLEMLIIRIENEVTPRPEDLATARRTIATLKKIREQREKRNPESN